MSDVLLKILSAVGILLLVLLTAAVAALLSALFFPFTYRLSGKKNTEETAFSVKLSWLFGLLRLRYDYPRPQLLTVKLLCFPIFKRKLPPDGEDAQEEETAANKAAENEGAKNQTAESEAAKNEHKEGLDSQAALERAAGNSGAETSGAETSAEAHGETHENAKFEKILKIKYTILEMYDKIKKMWENISYYLSILQEEDTRRLTGKVGKHLVRILKSIRPRRIKADILFGTGEPDTTGYAYGAYCILTPFLGSKVLLTPDFERRILQGEVEASGHIIVFALLKNALKVAFDKRLHALIKKCKKETIKKETIKNETIKNEAARHRNNNKNIKRKNRS